MKFVVLFVLIALNYVLPQQIPVILCGRKLAEARVLLCYGAEYVNKRNSLSLMSDLDEDKSGEHDWPWYGRRGALTANWSRYKRGGLADECCLKPCTTDVILNYC